MAVIMKTLFLVGVMLTLVSIPACNAWRNVRLSLDFPDDSCPPTNTSPRRISVIVETGSTVLDAMIAAADRNSYFNFKSTYFGDSGFFIEAINGTANQDPCYWFFDYIFPGLSAQRSQFGVSNVVVPSGGFSVVFRYMRYVPQEGDEH